MLLCILLIISRFHTIIKPKYIEIIITLRHHKIISNAYNNNKIGYKIGLQIFYQWSGHCKCSKQNNMFLEYKGVYIKGCPRLAPTEMLNNGNYPQQHETCSSFYWKMAVQMIAGRLPNVNVCVCVRACVCVYVASTLIYWQLVFYGHFCAHGRPNGPSELQR